MVQLIKEYQWSQRFNWRNIGPVLLAMRWQWQHIYIVRSLPVWVFLCFFNDNWAHLLSILQSSTRIDHTQWEHHEDGKSASILRSTPGIHGFVLGHFGAKPLFDAVLKVLQNLQPKEQNVSWLRAEWKAITENIQHSGWPILPAGAALENRLHMFDFWWNKNIVTMYIYYIHVYI